MATVEYSIGYLSLSVKKLVTKNTILTHYKGINENQEDVP